MANPDLIDEPVEGDKATLRFCGLLNNNPDTQQIDIAAAGTQLGGSTMVGSPRFFHKLGDGTILRNVVMWRRARAASSIGHKRLIGGG
jgi:hypothetical protein